MVHQQFKVGLDTGEYNRSLSKMESDTKRSTSRTASEFGKVDKAAKSGASKASQVAGAVSLQAQDVAVQMQMGAKASTIIAQQGSQILSVFGPTGMLVGGLVASAALMWELVKGETVLAKHAKEKAVHNLKAEASARENAVETLRENQKAIDIAKNKSANRGGDIRSGQISKEEAKQLSRNSKLRAQDAAKEQESVERRLNAEKEIADIRSNDKLTKNDKKIMEESVRDRLNAEDKAQSKLKAKEQAQERIKNTGDDILDRADQIRGKGLSKAAQRREDRAQARAERRAINEEIDREDRKRRNRKQGTDDPSEAGLSKKEKEEMRKAREKAVNAAKNKEKLDLSDDTIRQILNGIDGLIAR